MQLARLGLSLLLALLLYTPLARVPAAYAAAGISVTPTSGLVTTETTGTATFTIVLNQQPTANVSIGLSSSNTAEGTVTATPLTFTSGNWNVPQTVTISGVNDDVDDGDIAYSIVTAAATSLDPCYSVLNPANVNVTNLDDDTAGITVSAISGNTSETGGTATFTVVLNSQPTNDVSIGLSSSDTSEGTVDATALSFTPGNWNTPQTVTVSGVNDDVDDDDITYTVVIAAASSLDSNYNQNPADISVVNLGDDTAGITVSAISGNTTEAGGTATFTVRLDSEPTNDVSIDLSSSATAEGTVSPATLTFTVADWSTPKTVAASGVDDAVDDGDIAYSIVTAAATSSDPKYSGRDAADVNLSNLDNDGAGIIVSQISGNTSEAGGTATFTVQLASQPTANVSIDLSSSDTSEGTVTATPLLFTNGDWNIAQTVVITGVNDDVDDGDIDYTIIFAAATSTDIIYSDMDAADVPVTNLDDDTAGISVSPISGNTGETGGAATFSVMLTSQPTATVTIDLSSNDTTEGTVSPASLTFTPANWNTPRVVTVKGVDDHVVDGNMTYKIITGAASSADPAYNGLAVADVTVVNNDDPGNADARRFIFLPLIRR